MADDIKLVVGVDYKELTGLIKTADQTKRTLSSVAKEFVRTGDQKQYMASINRIVQAQKKLDSTSQMTRSKIMKLGAQMQQEVKFTNALTAATQRLSVAQKSSNKVLQQTKNRMNGNNMAIQQLGYQFGDFAVQVQGGTSAFVAFSQQGAQLAGILPSVAGPLGLSMGAAVGLSAALGVLIPVGSAVGRMFFEMKNKVKEAKDAFSNTITAINDYRESVEFSQKSTEELNAEFGKSATQLKGMQELLQSVAVSRAFDSLTTGSSMFGEDLDDAVEGILQLRKNMETVKFPTAADIEFGGSGPLIMAQETVEAMQAGVDSLASKLGLSADGAISLQKALHKITTSKDMEGLTETSLEAVELIKSMNLEFGNIPKPLGEVILKLEELAGASSRATNEVDKITDAEQELLDLTIKISQSTPYEPMSLLQIEAAKAQAEMVKVFEASADLKDEIGDAAFEAIRLADVDIAAGVSTAAKEAAKLAANLNISLLAAMNLQNLQGSKVESGGRGSGVEYRGQQDYTSELGYESVQSLIDKFNNKKNKGNKPTKDPIADFQKKLDLERELLGVSEARQEVLQALGSDVVAKNPEIVAGMEHQIAVTNELIALEKERQGIIDSITGSMETGFMAMIDGTMSVKDAFKSMAAAIIKELIQVMIVQKAVAGLQMIFGGGSLFGGASWSANGDVVGSSGIQAYADGGVVNSPTMFKHGGGLGVMGEAGPEAIMPLKRGANGKLGVQMEGGGGDTINVVQNFSFQANGDDSVKKIIAQAAPKIAQMTKSSLLNDRRRGGATKAAFG